MSKSLRNPEKLTVKFTFRVMKEWRWKKQWTAGREMGLLIKQAIEMLIKQVFKMSVCSGGNRNFYCGGYEAI